MVDKLLSCPFCGSEPDTTQTRILENWFAGCHNVECEFNPTTSGYDLEDEAITAWNTRISTTPNNAELVYKKKYESVMRWVTVAADDLRRLSNNPDAVITKQELLKAWCALDSIFFENAGWYQDVEEVETALAPQSNKMGGANNGKGV